MKISLIFLILCTIFFYACDKNTEQIVAEVNGETLTLERFKGNFSDSEWTKMSISEKQTFIQNWVQVTLFAQEADKLEISSTAEIRSRIENVSKKIKSNVLVSTKLANITASEEELFDYYKLHQSKFQRKVKQLNIQRIFVKEASKLAYVRQEISDKSFNLAAKKHSEETLGRNGGIVGWVSEKDIDKVFWNAVQDLKRLHYKTVKADKGFYIIRFTDTRTKSISKDFLEVKNEIRKLVLQEKQEELYEKLLKDLKSKADISIEI